MRTWCFFMVTGLFRTDCVYFINKTIFLNCVFRYEIALLSIGHTMSLFSIVTSWKTYRDKDFLLLCYSKFTANKPLRFKSKELFSLKWYILGYIVLASLFPCNCLLRFILSYLLNLASLWMKVHWCLLYNSEYCIHLIDRDRFFNINYANILAI